MGKEPPSDTVTLSRKSGEAGIVLAFEEEGTAVWRLACLNRGGLPDLWVNPPNGPGFFVEVSTEKRKPSAEEIAFAEHTTVHYVHSPLEARPLLSLLENRKVKYGESEEEKEERKPIPAQKRRYSLYRGKFRIRKRGRKRFEHVSQRYEQWKKEAAQVWFLERIDDGMPHCWVKPKNAAGYFAHLSEFGKRTKPQKRFATHNAVRKIVIPKPPSTGCCLLPFLSAGAALLVSAALLLGNAFLA